MKFRDTVLQVAPDLEHIPSGFKRYNQIMILRSVETLSSKLGEVILSLYPWCKSVYQHDTTQGESRIPNLRFLAGIDDPHVIHKENQVQYAIDLSRITFSGGNRRLREKLVAQVQDGEFLLDMFAAVGNLSLQPLVHKNIEGLLVERNPYTFQYLQKSLELNHISPDIAINADCRSLEMRDIADRIFMGYHEVDESHLQVACQAAKSGAYIHLHPLVQSGNPELELEQFEHIFSELNIKTELFQQDVIKNFAPGVDHLEVIYQIFK